ncbi:hypothetical protein Tco_1297676 [Tanacetum coccineum]
MAASYRTAATGAITGATVGPPVNGSGQQWSTTINGGGQLWPMTVTGGGPPLTISGSPTDHQSTTGQRWLTASQRPGQQWVWLPRGTTWQLTWLRG